MGQEETPAIFGIAAGKSTWSSGLQIAAMVPKAETTGHACTWMGSGVN